MPQIEIDLDLDGDGCWPDLIGRRVRRSEDLGVAGLAGGTAGGAPSVAIRVNLPDGEVVVAETTLALFLTVADALRARYGDPRR